MSQPLARPSVRRVRNRRRVSTEPAGLPDGEQMHKSRAEATVYAQMLADLHGTPRCVVKLPPVEPGSARDVHGVTGLYYGGVEEDEREHFINGGAVVLATVYPHPEEAKKGVVSR